jgi:hypothetical protein
MEEDHYGMQVVRVVRSGVNPGWQPRQYLKDGWKRMHSEPLFYSLDL